MNTPNASIPARALDLLANAQDGLTSKTLADRLGITPVAAACALGRLFWRGQVDRETRYRDPGHQPYFLYTAPAHARRAATVED